MESGHHNHGERTLSGRAGALVVFALALAGGLLWMRGRGQTGFAEGQGPVGDSVLAGNEASGHGAGSFPPEGGGLVSPAGGAPVQREFVADGALEQAMEQGVGHPAAGDERPWTLRFTPVLAAGGILGGVDVRLLATEFASARSVVAHWRDHVEVEVGSAVELEASGPRDSLVRGGLWIATDAAALQALDGRLLRGDPGARAGVRLTISSAAVVNDEERVLEFGRVVLEPFVRLGEVSLQGHWLGSVRVEVWGPGSFEPGSPFGARRMSRRFQLTAGKRSLVVYHFHPEVRGPRAKWTATASNGDHAGGISGSAECGSPIDLHGPLPSGMDMSLDLASFPTASRIVIPGPGATHAAILDKDQYRAMLDASRWSAVVPQSLAKKGKAGYELGFVAFPDGPARIEVWSVRGPNGLRSLLHHSQVDVQGDIIPVVLK